MSTNGKPLADDFEGIAKRLKGINPDWKPFLDPRDPNSKSSGPTGTQGTPGPTGAANGGLSNTGVDPAYLIDLYRRARSAVCNATGYSKKIGGYIRDPQLRAEYEKYFENGW